MPPVEYLSSAGDHKKQEEDRMRLPGFTAKVSIDLSWLERAKPRTDGAPVAPNSVVPQARQVGPGIRGIVQYCGDNVCLLYHCDDTGCHPLGFSNF
jgi:hypothetical protein